MSSKYLKVTIVSHTMYVGCLTPCPCVMKCLTQHSTILKCRYVNLDQDFWWGSQFAPAARVYSKPNFIGMFRCLKIEWLAPNECWRMRTFDFSLPPSTARVYNKPFFMGMFRHAWRLNGELQSSAGEWGCSTSLCRLRSTTVIKRRSCEDIWPFGLAE